MYYLQYVNLLITFEKYDFITVFYTSMKINDFFLRRYRPYSNYYEIFHYYQIRW